MMIGVDGSGSKMPFSDVRGDVFGARRVRVFWSI
jgi:hypothetical protein